MLCKLLTLFTGHAWANTLGIQNATVYKISGFKKVDEYQIIDGEVIEDKPETPKNPEELEE